MMFRSAAEARSLGAPLVRLFVTGLARPPSPSELAPLVTRLRAGDDLGDAAVAMTASAEFTSRHGPDGTPDPHYVRALFWAIDGEDPPDAERDRLLAQINPTRASLLAQVSQSPRARAAISLTTHFYNGALRPDDDVCYQLWLDEAEPTVAFEGDIPALAVSIVIWAASARPDLVAETLQSLAAQTSPHWEAILVSNAPAPAHASDVRIRLIAAGPSRAEALTRAAAVATGTLVGFVEASDRLAPQAVEAAARLVAAQPGLRLIYTDEDSIAGDGTRSGVRLKGGWSPDLLLSGDALGQLALFDRKSVLAAGGLASDAGAFGLLDLALRLTAGAGPGSVAHQPGILFHRGRARDGRPAPFPHSRAGSGLPVLDGVIDRHLARHPGLTRITRPFGHETWPGVAPALPATLPLVSVIILTKDKAALLAECLAGVVQRTDYGRLEILIVDNGSSEPEALALLDRWAAQPAVRVLRAPGPFSWSALNNLAAAQAGGEILLLLNNDVSVTEPGWLRSMVGHAIRPDVGVVGARLLFPDGTLQHGGVLLGPKGAAVHALTGAAASDPGYLGQVALLRDLSAVTGACVAIRRAVFERLGGLEYEHLRVAWGDIDLCLRAREAGLRVLWDPGATLVHREMATRGQDHSLGQQARHETERAYMRRRWPDATDHDPFVNPALRADPHTLALRMPEPGAASRGGQGAELHYDVAELRQALTRSRAANARLQGLWPRAELQQLRLDLAEHMRAHAALIEHNAVLAGRLAGLPQPALDLVRRLMVLTRLSHLARRAWGGVRRTPQRRQLLRQRRADYAVIAASPAFDRAWYRAAAMDGNQTTDPVAHYLWKGIPAGREPHALFDSAWYAARNPAIGLENPFAHYLRVGMAADQDPHPLFDTPFYLAQAPEASGRALTHFNELAPDDTRVPVPMFDRADYPDGLAHWIHVGAAEGRDPHALFATAWYRRTHLAGTSPKRNPLAHWVREGAAAGLATNPYGLDPALPLHLAAPVAEPDATILLHSGQSGLETARSLHAVAQNSGPATFDVILIDPAPVAVPRTPHLRTAPSRGAGAADARGRTLVFLGAGAVVHPGWLSALLATADADGAVGLVCGKTVQTGGSLRSAGVSVGPDGHVTRDGAGDDPALPRYAFSRTVDAPDPDAMLVRREVWHTSGGFDHVYDTDLAATAALATVLRARGLRTVLQPASVVSLPHDPVPASAADIARLRRGRPLLPSAPDRRVLLLVDTLPAPDAPDAGALHGMLAPGVRAAVHAAAAPAPETAAAWEFHGVEVVRGPVTLAAWLAEHGASLDEIRSSEAPAQAYAAVLQRETGAPVLPWPCDKVARSREAA